MSAITFQQNGVSSEYSANNPDTDDTEKRPCHLLEDDTQCGYIFFSESLRVLKFFCTFCRETYDDIYFYCEHLSVHINDNVDQEKVLNSNSPIDEEKLIDGQSDTIEEMEDFPNNQEFNDYSYEEVGDFCTELDEADEIAAEVEQEMQHLYNVNKTESENSNSGDFLGYDEDDSLKVGQSLKIEKIGIGKKVIAENSTDYECLIDSSKHEEFKLEPDKKKKNVKTVKIIAVKNKIAELYEKIKEEEEVRTRATAESMKKLTENLIKKNCNASTLQPEENEKNVSKDENATAELKRTIIGETIITLIPDSASQPAAESTTTAATEENQDPSIERKSVDVETNELNDRTCPACNKVFRNAFSLSVHKRTHYMESDCEIKLAHKCSDCDQLFNRITELKEHIEKEHYPDGYICKVCNKKLSSILLLESHMKKVHLSKPFTCEICKRNFSSRAIFEEHVQTHIDMPNFRCHICGRKYNTFNLLQEHKARHQERVPETCVVCGKKTLRITQHMKIHEPRPKRIISCKYCGKIFNFSSGLSHHIRIMHNESRLAKNAPETNTKRKSDEISADSEEFIKKEEEAKKVIVELIHNATYKSFLPDNFSYDFVNTPPIAREETISAVNSITNSC